MKPYETMQGHFDFKKSNCFAIFMFATAMETATEAETATMIVISTVVSAATVNAMNTVMVVETIIKEGMR